MLEVGDPAALPVELCASARFIADQQLPRAGGGTGDIDAPNNCNPSCVPDAEAKFAAVTTRLSSARQNRG